MTTEQLWRHIIERAADDEAVGVDVRGQQVLFVHSGRSGNFQTLVENTIETGGAGP
jgi:hypothetical protein